MHAVVRLYYLLRCCYFKKTSALSKLTLHFSRINFAFDFNVLAANVILLMSLVRLTYKG